MRQMTVVHRTDSEIDRLLLRQLSSAKTGMDAAELALRVGCGAERVRGHLARLEREGHARRSEHVSGARWTAH
jgi:predicted ArsR family transcriptional regulator